jgi:uncharacterized membrane protein
MTKLARFLDINENKGPILSVVLALVFVSIVVLGYYFLVLDAPPEGFSSMYVLDAQKTTESYPEFLIINENNTFNLWIGVENHKGKTQSYEIQQKLTKDPILTFPINEAPIDNFAKILDDQEIWEMLITTTISDPGNYSLVFELYLKEDGVIIGDNTGPDNYVLLNIEADFKSQD